MKQWICALIAFGLCNQLLAQASKNSSWTLYLKNYTSVKANLLAGYTASTSWEFRAVAPALGLRSNKWMIEVQQRDFSIENYSGPQWLTLKGHKLHRNVAIQLSRRLLVNRQNKWSCWLGAQLGREVWLESRKISGLSGNDRASVSRLSILRIAFVPSVQYRINQRWTADVNAELTLADKDLFFNHNKLSSQERYVRKFVVGANPGRHLPYYLNFGLAYQLQ